MNWDKPLREHEFKRSSATDVAIYHGYFGQDKSSRLSKDLRDHSNKGWLYENYISYCILMNSPLMQALS